MARRRFRRPVIPIMALQIVTCRDSSDPAYGMSLSSEGDHFARVKERMSFTAQCRSPSSRKLIVPALPRSLGLCASGIRDFKILNPVAGLQG